MAGRIGNVQIGCGDGPAYQREGGALAALYGELLGMVRYDPGYIKLRPEGTQPDGGLEIGFENGDDVRPRWPDPDHPQQVHLDIEVADVDKAGAIGERHGAVLLRDGAGPHRVYADSVGHPFCLDPGGDGPAGRISCVVFDCPDPSALARFYEDLLDLRTRVLDTVDRVEIAGDRPGAPSLAFQRSPGPPPQWPDPSRPAQLHLDLVFDDGPAAAALLRRLGAPRIGALPLHSVWADPAGHPFCGPASGYVTVRDLPPGVTSVWDFPPDWKGGNLPLTQAEIVAGLRQVAPDIEFVDARHGHLTRPGLELAISIGGADPPKSVVISFDDAERSTVDPVIRPLLDGLGLGAFDADAPGRIFT